eukprot:m.274846 g.274846  ORF g.274846 m.274846 type:complete len:494 (+) comp16135_c0_seq10:935-2416(+)
MDMTSERPQEVNFGVEFPPQSGNRLPLDPYRLLQVGRSASGADIRAAYLGRCADFHPDKHPVAWATAAAQAFVAVHDAYALLSDPVTRAAYDENREARGARDWVPAISGDPITTALRLAWDLRSLLPFVGELDALERAHGLEEGSLRVATSANCPCSATATAPGGTCATLPLPATPDRPNRGVLCTAHKLVHQCDSACTSPKTVCPMWARTLVESYRATVRGAWVLRTAGDTPTPTAFPGRQYWFNPCAGISAWLDGSTTRSGSKTRDVGQEARPTKMERNYGMKSLVEALARRRAIESGELWASEIIPGKMFLGCGRDAQNREQLQAHHVSHIINVADDVPNYYEKDRYGNPTEFKYTSLNVADFGADRGISRVFEQATEAARSAMVGDGVVLIHCANGSNRSVTVAIAVMMSLRDWTLAESWEWVCARRPGACPLRDNRTQLLDYELKIYGVSTMVEACGALGPASVYDSPCLRSSVQSYVANRDKSFATC